MRPAPYSWLIAISVTACAGSPAPPPPLAAPVASAPAPAASHAPPRPHVTGIPRFVAQSGHSGDISNLAWNADGTLLASSSKEDGVKLWAVPAGFVVADLHTRITDPSTIAFSPDRHSLAVGNWNGALEIWDLGELRLRTTHRDHEASLQSLAYTPDGALLLSGGQDGAIYVYESRAQKLRGRITGMPAAIYAMAFSPDGKRLACSAGSKVQIRETGTWRPLHALEAHAKPVTSLAWSHDSRSIATGGEDGLLITWDAERGSETRRLDAGASVQGVSWDGQRNAVAAALADGTVLSWDTRSGQNLLSWKCTRCPKGSSSIASFNPAGTRVAVANSELLVREVASGAYSLATEAPRSRLFAWQPGTDKLLVEDSSGRVNLVEVDSLATSVAAWWSKDLLDTSWSRDGSRLAVLSGDGTLRVVDGQDGKTIASYDEESLGLPGVELSPDGKLLAASDPKAGVRLWRVGTRGTRRISEAPVGPAAWSPDSSILAVCEGRNVRLSQVATGRETARLVAGGELAALSYRPDGKQLAASELETGRVRIWDTATRKEVAVIEGPARPLELSYSPDGRWLAAAGRNSGVRVWEAATGKLRRSIEDGGRLSWHRGSGVLSVSGREHALHRIEDGETVWVEAGGSDGASVLVFATDGLHSGSTSASVRARFHVGNGAVDFGMLTASQLPGAYRHQRLLRDFVEGRPLPHPQAGVAVQPH